MRPGSVQGAGPHRLAYRAFRWRPSQMTTNADLKVGGVDCLYLETIVRSLKR